jgi:hypothetical protein
MPDEIVITSEDEPSTPVEIEIEVEAPSEDHTVDFAERITRLEMSMSDKVDRSELSYINTRIDEVAQLATVNAAVTEVVVEAVEEMVSEPEPEVTPTETTEPTSEEESDDAPKSKRHRWWGN